MTNSAKVAGLYRYPVQSVQGEELPALTFGPKGIQGDRAFAIADLELGVVAHVSRAKKQYRDMFSWRARYLAEPQAGIDLPLRYSPDLDARVLLPVLGALRAEVGRAAPVLPLGRDERDLVLNLHGAIVFVGIRRHVYGAVMSDARHMELGGGIIGTYLPGALAALKLSFDN